MQREEEREVRDLQEDKRKRVQEDKRTRGEKRELPDSGSQRTW
jgi:hypothetical protein